MTLKSKLAGSVALGLLAFGTMAVQAEDRTITVLAGGTGETGIYRVDAIKMAAELLQREYALSGKDIKINIETRTWSGWDDFKQAVTLAAESGSAPIIIVSGHEDIGPWAQAGILRPIEDYLAARHISVVYPDSGRLHFDLSLEAIGIERDIAVAVPSFSGVPEFLRGSTMLASLPSLLRRRALRDFAQAPLPLAASAAGAFRELPMYMVWHRRYQSDPAHIWLRGQLEAVAAEHSAAR